ncbi:FCD domain-containing protein [Arthrobacter sp. JZ12]|uniref:FadR/GntR family transcriptional regulator n=1 Tax=Arthrobacter sp. JZ12 TaxID=2654190 RepID=UPI002B49C0CC|nr:FCD domain-containing protein [Arthrobacter sp. JZ12]WRH26075.1 FCD domain-containing protein [Arthrobacter sp. JZ12]
MRTHQLVQSWLEEQLSAGRLAVGDRLPGERTVAEQLGISRASAREGIRVLEAMGVVRAGVGSGPAAGTVITANPGAALGAALRLHMASSHLPVEDIVQTRLLLETWAAAHADASAPAMEDAGALLGAMDTSALDEKEFLRLDALFHVALAEAAGNILIGAMMSSLRESIEGYTLQLTRNLPDWPVTSARLRAEHRKIHQAIKNDDGALAARLIARHIEGFYEEAGI